MHEKLDDSGMVCRDVLNYGHVLSGEPEADGEALLNDGRVAKETRGSSETLPEVNLWTPLASSSSSASSLSSKEEKNDGG